MKVLRMKELANKPHMFATAYIVDEINNTSGIEDFEIYPIVDEVKDEDVKACPTRIGTFAECQEFVKEKQH